MAAWSHGPASATLEVGRVSLWRRYARVTFLIPALAYVLFAFALPIVYNPIRLILVP
jgi:hypothetical protein